MKKLLKSILIATASIGAIAGSTAAVVSCGSSGGDEDNTADQAKYDSQATAILAKVSGTTKTSGLPIKANSSDLLITNTIAEGLKSSIDKNSKAEDVSTLSGELSGITVTLPSNFDKTVTTTVRQSTGVKVTIGVSPGTKAKAHEFDFVFGYTVAAADANAGQQYTGAQTAVQEYFADYETNNANLFKFIPTVTSIDDVQAQVKSNIIKGIKNHGIITAGGVLETESSITVRVGSLPTETTAGRHQISTIFITMTPAFTGITPAEIALTNANYNIPTADETGYDAAISKIVTHFKTNDLFTATVAEITTSNADASGQPLKDRMRASVFAFIQTLPAADLAFLKASFAASDVIVSATINDLSVGTTHATSKSRITLQVTSKANERFPIAMEGAQFKITG